MNQIENSLVLVVDDNDAVRSTLLRVLESRGLVAVGVASGEEAIAAIRGTSFDVALCDIHLPGINGIETALTIRAALPGCRILLMSGDSGSPDLLAQAERDGYRFEVLGKPFDPPMLFAMLAARPSSAA